LEEKVEGLYKVNQAIPLFDLAEKMEGLAGGVRN